MPTASFPITYEKVDFEVVPQNLLGGGWPSSPIRIQLGNYAPAALMVASAVIYYGLVKLVMPATRPTSEASRKRLGAVRDAHNLFLFVFSAVCCISTAFWLYSEGQLFSWSDPATAPLHAPCMPAANTGMQKQAERKGPRFQCPGCQSQAPSYQGFA